MSRTADKHYTSTAASAGVVSPPPSLAANGARHRSGANYAQSYGRSSFEQQQHKFKQPLQPTPHESLRRTHSKSGLRGGRQAPSSSILADVSISDESEDGEEGVDVSAMTTPAQSYVPEARRRGVPATSAALSPSSPPHIAPAAAAVKPMERNADKENTNVVIGPAAPVVVVEAAHSRPTLKSAPATAAAAASASSSASPTVLYRRTGSGVRGGGGGGSRALAPGAASNTSPTTAAPAAPVLKRTTSLKARLATAGARKVSAVSPSPHKQPQQQEQQRSTSSPPTSSALNVAYSPSAAVAEPSSPPPKQPSHTSAATAATSPVDWEVQVQLDKAEAVLRYVSEVARALSERRRCGPPPDSTDDFRASVVPSRRSPGLSTTQQHGPEAEGGGRSGVVSGQHADASVALLPDLHRTAGALLSAFTRLEYAQLSEDVDLPLLESESVQRSAQLRRLVDGVARQLALHESPDVRQRLAQRRDVFTSFHGQVDFIARMAQQVVLLRGIAAHRDLAEAREVLDSFTRSVEQQEAEQRARDNDNNTTSTDAHGASAFRFSPLRMLQASPFFEWLDARWFPTMRAWRQVVLDARQLASTGATDAALRRSRQAALQVAGLHELLRPGETVASLHHEEVVVPVTELGNSFAQKRAVLDELRSVVSEEAEGKPVDMVALAKALKSAQAFAQVRSGRPTNDSSNGTGSSSGLSEKDDIVLVKAAEDLLRRVQEVRRVRDAIAALLQTPSPALTALLEHITRVNELVMDGHLARDDVAARAALEAGRLALGRGAETADSVSSGRTSAASGVAAAAAAASSARNTPHRSHNPQPEVPPLDFDGLTQSPPPPSQQSSRGTANRWIGDGFPAGFDVHSLYIPHTTAPSWPSDLDVLYRESCDVFCMLFMQRQAQRQLELALGHSPAEGQGRSLGGAAHPQPQHYTTSSIGANGCNTPSPQITPRRPTRDVGTPATAKTTATTNRSSEEGSPVTLTTARSSGCDGGRDGFNVASGLSADELRRRIQQAEDAGVGGSLVEEARARLRRLLTVRLKIHFDAQTRVLPIADAAQADFTAVYAQVHAHCQSQLAQSPSSASPQWAERRLRIRYEDSDGDFISLLTQQDWDVMLAEMQGGEGTSAGGRVELFCDYLVQPNTSPPPALPSADNASSPHRGEGGAEAGSGQDTSNPHHQHQGHEEGNEAANTTTTPEKQPDVFARLAASKEVTPVAHGGRGGGGGGNRTPRGRARLGGPSPGSSPQQALIPRTRNAASGIVGANGNRQGTSSPAKLRPAADSGKSPSSKGQANAVRRGEGVSSATGGKKASPHAVLTAENLRRNLFRSSPSPPSTEGRRSGGGGGGAAAAERTEGNAGRSSEGRESATSAHQAPPPPSSSSAVAAKTPQQTQQKQGDAAASVALAATAADDSPTATRVVEKNPPAVRDASSSAVRLDLDGARRWVGAEGAEEDELQLLEIQTRASISTVRLDPYVSTSSFDLLPSSSAVTATARQQQQQQPQPSSSGRNTFTTSHCSRTPPANTEMPPSPTSPAAAAAAGAAAAGTRKGRVSQSPPRRAARRWTSDDFSLDEVETVCSERSRLAMQPAAPRGPTTLPPRPQTSAGANRTPQRVRRGARGTPTRSRTDAEGGEDDAAWAESVDDVFAEMQRMREENSKAMGQPRKAAWH